ncbi:glycosyltransferase family 1 protein [Pseudomonas sp. ABC1]|uniref:glycosyltransferase family protein n=1 Tax=Pseudomonas sp. ABC1 TaxID=2748080 RepID=UPI0015C2DC74|nr:glycosyltransferase [Pseudomonas sp. ABC1]QLF94153.1 glycosyltransferase family 1 protein [Pseudomonas sp. ABC1]
MKLLVLGSAERQPDFSYVYESLGKQFDLDLVLLDKLKQKNLYKSIGHIDFSIYDRVLFDLNFKHICRQTRFLRRLSGVLIYEEDACQNYLGSSRWCGRFSRFYKALPHVRIVVTGHHVAERLSTEGFNVHFIPKGYDPRTIFPDGFGRDIELGFIGRIASSAYAERKKLLETLAAEDSLQLLRTLPGEPYRKMLSRIRYFISADIGFNEYMAKNFEAMACGCVLLAWRQGREEAAIGLEDGRHLLLYSSLIELREQLARLRNDSELELRLATEGRRFVSENLSHEHLAKRLAGLLQEPWPVSTVPIRGGWLRSLFGMRKS